MLRRRAPWVAVVAGGSFLGYFLLLVYCDIRRPEPPRMLADFDRGALVVRAVASESPAARAGLRPGDRIVSWSGRPATPADTRSGTDGLLGGRFDGGAPVVEAPPRCREFFSRALALDPAVRPDSPLRFLADLEDVLA